MLAAWLTASVPAVAQKVPHSFQPEGNWTVENAEKICAARRVFAADDMQLLVQFGMSMPGNWFELTLASADLVVNGREVVMRIEPDLGDFTPANPKTSKFASDYQGVIFSGTLFPPETTTRSEQDRRLVSEAERRDVEERISGLSITGAFAEPIYIATGPLAQAMQNLRDCSTELLKSFGFDTSTLGRAATGVVPIDQFRWARKTQESYPRDMVRMRKNATVRLWLQVDVDGRATHCHAYNSEPFPSFEKAACASAMKFARFKPALDEFGDPVPGVFSTTTTYSVN